MVTPISSILGLLIYSKTVVALYKLSDSFHGGLASAFRNLRVVLCVNNPLGGCFAALLLGHTTHS